MIQEYKFKWPISKKNALLHIFPNQPKYLIKPSVVFRRNPKQRKTEYFKREMKEEKFLKSDSITDFKYFVNMLDKKVTLNE